MNEIQKIVNDPEWQAIRISFLGTWKTKASENCKVLKEYVGDFSDPLKVRRVHNYLTGSAFRIGIISHPSIDLLLFEIRRRKLNAKNN